MPANTIIVHACDMHERVMTLFNAHPSSICHEVARCWSFLRQAVILYMLIQSFSVIYLPSASTTLPQSSQLASLIAHTRDSTHKRRAKVKGQAVSLVGMRNKCFHGNSLPFAKRLQQELKEWLSPFFQGTLSTIQR